MLLILSVLIVLAFFLFIFLSYGAKFLVTKDDINYVDNAVIVLLMGSIADRALGAAELFKKSHINKIIMVRSPSPGTEKLESIGIHLEDISDISKRILIELGVSEEDIIILPGNTKSTKDEAIAVKKYFKNNDNFNAILLVTSEYHSSRSKYMFKQILKGTDKVIYSYPTPYGKFEANDWYRNRESAKQVVYEYLKWLYFTLIERFRVK